MPHRRRVLVALVAVLAVVSPPFVAAARAQSAPTLAAIDRGMDAYRLDAHIPGMAWGIVKDGKLVHVKGAGVQTIEGKRPVTADTLFRIASMTKAFTALTILKLRDDGRLALDAPAETYVPELKALKYPTDDSPRIRVRELLTHTAGFVTDDPWGDRQTPLPEREFSAFLAGGVPFTRPPATAMEYSNLGYALLGRIIANVSGTPYDEMVQRTLLRPLGMTSTSHHVTTAPADHRALGYRWEDDQWKLEPTMAHGAFGAMGGIQTSANDYAKWVAFLLSAWPPRDGADAGPVRRSSVRELAQGANYPVLRMRPGASGPDACRMAGAYGMGFNAATDCELGLTLSHSGGYPGYGSHLLLLPDYGVGIFAFANRTYAGPTAPVWDAAVAMLRAGELTPRPSPVSSALATAYAAAGRVYSTGAVTGVSEVLAMNFLMDRDAAHWAHDLAALKAQVGTCDTTAAIRPTGAASGSFVWTCATGHVRGSVLLAPTATPQIQALSLTRITP